MLLQRIELKGFLSHYGHRNGNGVIEPITIDFSSSPLWLVYGPNGSGKSALFDAITFALYKEHRGGKSNFQHLINDAVDRAEVGLEIKLDGQLYLITRTITRSARGTSVSGIVSRWNGNDYQAEQGTMNDVESWVKKNLRMSYQTFVSAVVLRQGEADAFLRAKPKDRKSCLLELLDLSFYEKLGDAAGSRYSKSRAELEKCKQDLDRLAKISDEDLTVQCRIIAEVEGALNHARQVLAAKNAVIADARRATDLIAEIAKKEKEQQADAELIQKASTIITAVGRYRDLSITLPLFENLWSARRRLADEVKSIQNTNQCIINLQEQNNKLSPQLIKAQEDEDAACKACTEAEAQLAGAQTRQQELARQSEQLHEIERFEQKICDVTEGLKPYQSTLALATQIERNYQRHEELREAVPQLQRLKTANCQLVETQKKFNASQIAVKKWQDQLEHDADDEARCRSLVEAVTQEYDKYQEELRQCKNQIELLQGKLAERDKVAGKEECPVCGSPLDSEEARARLQHERSRWQGELAQREEEKRKLAQQLARKEQMKRELQNKLTTAEQAARNADKQLARAQSDFDNAQSAVVREQQTVQSAQQQAGAWSDQLDKLATLEAELDKLKASSGERSKLVAAKQAESAAQATISTCQEQLGRLPVWSIEERQHVRSEAAKSAAIMTACQKKKDAAQRQVNEAKSNREAQEKQQQKLETDLRVAQSKLEELASRRQQAEQEFDHHQKALPQTWANHAAFTDEIAFKKLNQELAGLSHAETEETRLRQAQAREIELAGGINVLKSQLETIPAEHRRLVPEVEAELESARDEATQAEDKSKAAQQQLIVMESQKQNHEERQRERDAAEKELRYCKKLADALGRGGLQAKIVQAAQEAIQNHANTTLSRLSNGRWQIKLEEKTPNELEILARDLYQPADIPGRSFEYLSGGEKFRVAISLAIAIGQTVSGGRVDTLVIDEGFGALDEVNRELLVTELHRLSEEVLRGGRVIIVSHQEDVCEKFESRYRISKGDNNSVCIECNSNHY